jgi:hypothetical protein
VELAAEREHDPVGDLPLERPELAAREAERGADLGVGPRRGLEVGRPLQVEVADGVGLERLAVARDDPLAQPPEEVADDEPVEVARAAAARRPDFSSSSRQKRQKQARR